MNNFKDIPQELKDLNQWVLWKKSPIRGRIAKVPYSIDGQMARTNDSNTWSAFNDVIGTFDLGGYDGIGFVFTANDEYCGIDIDHCVKWDGYKYYLSNYADEIVSLLDSYSEISPSGTGIHVIIRGRKTSSVCHCAPSLNGEFCEVYDKGRYFCMTGTGYLDKDRIEDRQIMLDSICNSASCGVVAR